VNKVKALLLLLIALLQYRLWFGDGNVREFQRMNDHIAELRQEGAKRRERNAALEAEVMDLKQGLDAVEERARQDMDMIKEGEVFVQVIDPHQDEAPPTIIKKSAITPPKPKRDAPKSRSTESPAAGKAKPTPKLKPKLQTPKAPKAKQVIAPPPEPADETPQQQRPPNDEPE
jgi:cell division protein FtsB